MIRFRLLPPLLSVRFLYPLVLPASLDGKIVEWSADNVAVGSRSEGEPSEQRGLFRG